MKKILLIGATGMVGARIADEALRRGHEVTEVSRSGSRGIVADARDSEAIAKAARGHSAIVSAISPPRDGSDPAGPLLASSRSILDAARKAGVSRVLVVGGAGSLLLPDGGRVVDLPSFPAAVKPEALAQSDLLEMLRREAGDLDWSYLSPAAHIEPGERTAKFTLGLDNLVTDASGNSRISAEDYAVALIDELEQPAHIQERFTLGYV